MQKKYRLRFMLISYGLLFLLLLMACGAVGVYLYESAVGETEQVIRRAIETQVLSDDTRGMVGIQLDGNGNLFSTELKHISLREETIRELAEAVPPDSEETAGTTEAGGMQFRYMAIMRGGGRWIVAAECTRETAMIAALKRKIPLYIGIGTVLLIPIAGLLALWVCRPIAKAMEQQNDFVADATHELKTPLTVISTNTEAVLSNPDALIGTQDKWLGSIQGETNHMAGLVANLLFLAKADAGEIKLNLQDIDLSDMLEGLCIAQEADIYEAGIQFEYEMTPDLHCTGDWNRIRQMAGELLANAVKFTPPGSVIHLVVNRDRRLHPRIVVSNSGCPIPAEHLPKIFDRFYRVDSSRARSTGGSGLGLCVAKSIAQLHGGDITAECRSGINIFTATLGEPKNGTGENPQNPGK